VIEEDQAKDLYGQLKEIAGSHGRGAMGSIEHSRSPTRPRRVPCTGWLNEAAALRSGFAMGFLSGRRMADSMKPAYRPGTA